MRIGPHFWRTMGFIPSGPAALCGIKESMLHLTFSSVMKETWSRETFEGRGSGKSLCRGAPNSHPGKWVVMRVSKVLSGSSSSPRRSRRAFGCFCRILKRKARSLGDSALCVNFSQDAFLDCLSSRRKDFLQAAQMSQLSWSP